VLHIVRRLSVDAPVRAADTDDDVLRTLASCAHEVVDASELPAAQSLAALQKIANRYGRALGVGLKDLQTAIDPTADVDAGRATSRASA
jgi:non-specific serine/threonine protein kinase